MTNNKEGTLPNELGLVYLKTVQNVSQDHTKTTVHMFTRGTLTATCLWTEHVTLSSVTVAAFHSSLYSNQMLTSGKFLFSHFKKARNPPKLLHKHREDCVTSATFRGSREGRAVSLLLTLLFLAPKTLFHTTWQKRAHSSGRGNSAYLSTLLFLAHWRIRCWQ